MRLARCSTRRDRPDAEPRMGLWLPEAGLFVDLAAALESARVASGAPPANDPAWFDLDGPWVAAARTLASSLASDPAHLAPWRRSGVAVDAGDLRWAPPVGRPGKVVAVGLNYRDHAAEAGWQVPDSPVVFAKFASCLVGHDTPIARPAGSERVDFEAELAVVVGRRLRRADEAAARAAVFGYTIANDVSERAMQKTDGQWVRAKSCDTFGPLGPSVVTPDELPSPDDLAIRLWLNGQLCQDARTSDMIFPATMLLSWLSQSCTLEPGDVILTGTPPGVGFARRPPVYLAPGDRVEIEIEGLGRLSNTVAPDAPLG